MQSICISWPVLPELKPFPWHSLHCVWYKMIMLLCSVIAVFVLNGSTMMFNLGMAQHNRYSSSQLQCVLRTQYSWFEVITSWVRLIFLVHCADLYLSVFQFFFSCSITLPCRNLETNVSLLQLIGCFLLLSKAALQTLPSLHAPSHFFSVPWTKKSESQQWYEMLNTSWVFNNK